MIRNEDLVNKLIADLHFHNYLRMGWSSPFGEEMGMIPDSVSNSAQIAHVYKYIDDVFIDLYFRTSDFKDIRVPHDVYNLRITDKGKIKVESDYSLNLSNLYDRATFIDLFFYILHGYNMGFHPEPSIFENTSFFHELSPVEYKYGPVWGIYSFEQSIPYDSSFDWYLTSLYGNLHSKYNPAFRMRDLINFSEFYQKNMYNVCVFRHQPDFYYGLSDIGIGHISDRINGYLKIKEVQPFGEYTFEELLFLYCLLTEKLKMRDGNLTSFLASFFSAKSWNNSAMSNFLIYENSITDYSCIEPYLNSKDLYIRFTSSLTSEAFKFESIDNIFLTVQLFEEQVIRALRYNNTMPLPYLYHELNL